MARRFVNWGRTVRTRPTAWHAPASESQIAELVRGTPGQRLRVIGAGHSWSAIAAPEQIAITLDRFWGITEIDRERMRVTVRAGTRLHQLVALLAEAGFALPITGSIAAQSVAGLVATGTHGSSLVHGNLASLVDWMRLIDGRGEAVELEGERVRGAAVHLGALGIVTHVRLAIVPVFQLAETVERIPLRELAGSLPAIAQSAEYVKVWWLPHTRSAYVFRYERCDEPTTVRPSPARQRWFDENIMHALVFPLVLRTPGLIPRISPAVAKGFLRPRRVGPSALMLSTPMPARHRETEAALPMARAPEATDRIIRCIERERLTVNFPLEIRFVKGDRAWLSPAAGGDTCQIGAYCFGRRSTRYFAAFWREMRELGARPHWGKEHDHGADEVRELWPDAPKFFALRDELDPDRRFGSEFHARVLGP